jgi:hypothetical protein
LTDRPTSRIDPIQEDTEILRRMTPAKKLAVMTALLREAIELMTSGVRSRWPDLPQEEVEARVRTLVAGDRP